MANNKIIPINKNRLRLNVIIVVFLVLFVYLIIVFFRSLTTSKTKFYEVAPGSNAEINSKTYTGLTLWDEKIVQADSSGYIEYFTREGSRISKNTTLYSIDSSGKLTDMLTKDSKNNKLSNENISSLNDLINDFSNDYDDMSFSDVYDFKSSLKGSVIDLINTKSIKKIAKKTGTSFSINKPKYTGIVLFHTDGYENFKTKNITESNFTRASRNVHSFNTGDNVKSGDSIYKVITDDEWSIAVPFDESDVEHYKDKKGVKIKFVNDNLETTANIKIITGKDGNKYGILTLSKYAIRFAKDRYVSIQIFDDSENGLKIPKSTLVRKDVYIIPKEYGLAGANSDKVGFNSQVDKDGSKETKVVYPPIAYSDSKYYYVSTDNFKAGDVLIKPNSLDTFVVKDKKSFKGVYNINNGYTVFVRVKILSETDEYYIVEAGNIFSLSIYDRIVLDGNSVKENQIVSQ